MKDADIKVSMAIQKIAAGLNEVLEEVAGEEYGFMLLTFPFDREARCQYVSNAQREDAVRAISELLERWDEGMPDIPAHDVQ